MAGAQWPLLEDLRLAKTGFDEAIIDKLFSGKWPRLLHLDISINYFTYASAPALLSEEPAWPLMNHLHMGGCNMFPVSGALLQVTSQLQLIDLHDNLHLGATQALVPARWHNVSAIKLDGCRLHHDQVACLSRCTWPLEYLSLSRTCLDTLALTHLSSGNWPNLKKLDLCKKGDPLPAAAVAELVKGRWPLLKWLCLCNNGFSDACVLSELTKGDWPVLKTLQLACNAFPPESAADLA